MDTVPVPAWNTECQQLLKDRGQLDFWADGQRPRDLYTVPCYYSSVASFAWRNKRRHPYA